MKTKKKIQKSGKYPFTVTRNQETSDARKRRRQYMKDKGIIKEIKSLRNSNLKDWSEYLRDQINYGNRLHNEHIENVMRYVKQELSNKEGNIEKFLTDTGMSKENIDKQISRFRAKHRQYLS